MGHLSIELLHYITAVWDAQSLPLEQKIPLSKRALNELNDTLIFKEYPEGGYPTLSSDFLFNNNNKFKIDGFWIEFIINGL